MEQVETKVDVLASRSVGRNEASTDISEHPVDALAVLDRAMTQVRHCHEAHEIQEARKAIAELIEALRKAEDRLGVLIESDNEDHGGAAPEDVAAWEACNAALARVSGGGK